MAVQALQWARTRNYVGYSKFDALNSPLLRRLAGEHFYLRAGFTYVISRAPVNLRPLLGVRKGENPKALALFAAACLNLYDVTGERIWREEADSLLARLLRYSQHEAYSGHCWGYDHPWQNTKFFAEAYAPNTNVTVTVGEAFLAAYLRAEKKAYRDICLSIAGFLLDEVNRIEVGRGRCCMAYVPRNQWRVVNISAMTAGFLAKVGRRAGEDALLEQARSTARWVVDQQTAQGAWFYADPPGESHVRHDNYHTGITLLGLLDYYRATGDSDALQACQKGLGFYREKLFTRTGEPKWRSDRKYPLDICGAAFGVRTFSEAASLTPEYWDLATRVADWAVTEMLAPEGRFHYQSMRCFKKRYTLMRWCQGFMCHALSILCRNATSGPVRWARLAKGW